MISLIMVLITKTIITMILVIMIVMTKIMITTFVISQTIIMMIVMIKTIFYPVYSLPSHQPLFQPLHCLLIVIQLLFLIVTILLLPLFLFKKQLLPAIVSLVSLITVKSENLSNIENATKPTLTNNNPLFSLITDPQDL